MADPLTFADCVAACLRNDDLMTEYRRLRGSDFGLPQPPIVQAVDIATGKHEREAWAFFDFVRDCVWSRITPGASND